MKKINVRLLAIASIFSILLFSVSSFAMYDEKAFSDVDSGNENYEAIKSLKDDGVLEGYGDGSYKPDDTINRAEFLKIVMMSYGYEVEGYSDCFPDVTDQWFAPYVCKAENLGIVSGYDSGYFRPDSDINFAEASKIVAESFRLNADSSDSENWYEQFVVALELLSAIPTSIESFDKLVTRGEMAEIVWRIKAEKQTKSSYSYEGIKSKTYDEKTYDSTSDVTSITLSDDGDEKVSWTVDGYSESGYKVVWSLTSGPTYPTRSNDKYIYHSSPSTSSSSIHAFNGDGTYYVRVCEYLGGKCGTYSNEITVELDDGKEDIEGSEDSDADDTADVTSLTLSDDGDGKVSWTVDGYSESGYKVVWSLTSGPTYPLRSTDKYAYHSSPSTLSSTLNAFDGDGTYYVRVCEYLGGKCGVYSNEIEVEL